METMEAIVGPVQKAGRMAWEEQERVSASHREYKADGSVVTDADGKVEAYLFDEVRRAFPQANILTEETERPYDPNRPFTFAIDPIDGTDAYSQGMPGWSVCVGLLNEAMKPVAGVIYAPAWGSLFLADVAKRAVHNGRPVLSFSPPCEPLNSNQNFMIHSRLHENIDLGRLPGKLRSIGSTALHICFPLIYRAVTGAISGKGRIWDMAAAQAINLSVGHRLEYLHGGEIDYRPLVDGSQAPDLVLSGPREAVWMMRSAILGEEDVNSGRENETRDKTMEH